MKHVRLTLAVLLAAVVLSSCNKKALDALRTENATLKQLNEDIRVELAECNASSKSLSERIAAEQKRLEELRADYRKLQGSLDQSLRQNSQGSINISKLVDEINASNRYIKQLVDAKTKSDSLNIALTNKLTRSLDRDELAEVDVKVLKGVVYISLADNMLYKSGSYEINDTDPVPISKTNIRNNWDLSCLRASSVVQALQNDYGVDPKRLTAAGRGEYNPIATNDTELGKQRNRRTQIIITPKLDQFMDLIDEAPETSETTVE